jgi:protein-disulfide isomerase
MSQSKSGRRPSSRTQKRRQAQTRLIIIVTIGALLLFGGLVLLSLLPGNTDPISAAADYTGLQQEVIRTDTGLGFAIGDPDAPVTLVDYSDFSCPHCNELAGIIHQLINDYVRSGDLRVIYKPISFVNPPYSGPAAQAAICAGEQGKFWEMHDLIWSLYESAGPGGYTQRALVARAETLDLDIDAFRACYTSSETSRAVTDVLLEAQEKGITATPTLFVNGEEVVYRGADYAYADLAAAIRTNLGE